MFGRFPKFPIQDSPTIDDDLGGNDLIDPGFGDPGGSLGGGSTPSDTTRPSVSITSFTRTINIAYNGSGSSTIYVSASDYGSGIASVTLDGVQMLHNSGTTYVGVKAYSYNSSYAGTTRTNYFTIRATDGAGNATTASDYLNVVYASIPDNTAPSVSFTGASPTTVYLNNSTTAANVSLTVTASDTGGSGLASVSVNNGASQVYQYGSNWYFQKTFNFNDYGWGNTTVTFTATASDGAGNNSSATQNIVVNKSDSLAPTISSFTGPSSLNVSSSNQTATYAVTCSDNRGINSVNILGASYSSQSGSTYYFTESFATSSYGFGTTSVSRTASVSDAAGNTSTDSISFNVTKSDVTKPSISSFTVNDSTVSLTTGSQTQTVTYTAKATDNRGINSYSLPNATFSSQSGSNYYWTETFSYDDYSFGNTSVSRTVTFYDAAGNSRSSTLSLTVTKSDTQAPTISGFSANNDSIALNNSTTSASRTFTVTTTDNVAVSNVTVDGLTYSSRSGNNWYFTKTFSFGDYSFGSQTVTFVAVASDAAGNTSTRNASVTVTKSDTQAPSISSFTVSDSSISVTSSNTSQTVNFAVTATDNVGVNSVSVSGATYTGASGNTYNFSKTYSFSSYNYGTTNITETATVSDAAGNSTTSNKAMTVTKSDTTSPSISSFTVNDSSVSLTTSSTSQTVTFTVVTTDNRGISSVSVNNGASGGLNSGSSYYFTKTFSYADYNFGNTTTTFTATASDAAGNSTTATCNVTISKSDNQSPAIQSFSVNDSTVNVTTSSTSQTVTYTVKATDNRAISSVSIPGASHSGTSGSTYTFTETFNYSSYSFGTTTVTRTVTVADAAGNAATDSLTLTVTKTDNQNPVISNYAAANTSLSVTDVSTSATATFTATITDNVAIDYVRFEGNPPTGSSGSTYTYVKTYNYSDLSFGSNSITVPCYAQDTAGNSALVNETITISKSDTTAPTISNLSVSRDASVTTDNQSDTIIITADVTDNTGVSSVTIPGATFVSVSGNTYTFRKTYEYDDYSFGDTLDTITVTATDTGGNDDDDEVQATVSKTDTQAPTITSFGVDNATVSLLTSAQTHTAVFTVVTSDNVGVNSISVSGASQYSASGNTYVFHKTYRYANYSFGSSTDTVSLSVLDAAGNEATDSLEVTINKSDDQAPSINSFTVDDSSVTLLSSSKTQTITFSANVTDNRSVSSISVSGGVTATDSTGPDYTWTKTFDYDDYNYGTVNQNFTLTASDAAGNQSTSTITVSIAKTDDANPSITSIGRKNGSTAGITSVTLLSSSENTETVTFTVNVSDNVGVTGVTLTGATAVSNTATQYIFSKAYAFGSYSFGSTTDTLTATATDAAGNSSTSTTSITVIKTDNVAPSISSLSASSSTVALTSSAQNTETITFTATITDNVGINSVSFGGLTPSVSGNNYTWTKNYAYSSYSFGTSTDTLTLTVTDAAGNSSSDTVSVTITKTDNVAPTITSYSASATQLTWLASQNDSADKTVTFTVVTSDDVAIGSVAISGATQTNVSGSTYTFTRAYSRPVLGNSATSSAATLTVTDSAGNTATDSISISTVYSDNVNPTISSFSADDTTVALTNSNQNQTVTFTGVATDNHGVNAVYFDNNSPDSSSGNTHTWTKTYSYASYSFGNFTDTITFAATDNTGNTSTQDLVVNISKTDTVSPNITSFSSSASSVELTTSNTSESVTFTVVATDNVGVTGLSVSGATLVSNTGNTYGFVKSYAFDDYSFGTVTDTVTATATDAAGNSTTSSVTISVAKTDDTAPTITSFTVDDSSVVVSTDSQYQTITFSVTATDNVGIASVSIPGATYVSTSNATRTFTKTYDYDDLSFGTSSETFTVTVTDTLGNTATDTVTVSVTKNDSQDPSISSFTVSDSSITLTTDNQSQTVTFAVVATDNRAVTSKSVTGATFVNQSGNTFNFTRTFAYDDFNFGNSTRTISAIIGDAAGNTTSETLTVSISKTDNQDPTISSFTSNVSSINLKTSSQSATVNFTCVATDNVSVSSVNIGGTNATNSSGNNYVLSKTYEYDNYSFGSNSVTETAIVTDSAGNTSNSTVTITIIKTDDSSPTISSFGVDDSTVVLTTASQTQTVTFTASVSDNRAVTSVTIDGQSVTGSGNSYSLDKTYDYDDYSFGSNTDTVSIVATDAAGNTSTDSVTVSISKSDTQNPSISSFSVDDSTISLTTSDQTKRANFTAVVTDNVGVTSVTCSNATFVSQSGTTYTFRKDYDYGDYNFGSNTVTHQLTATDSAGNSSTSSLTVTVTKSDDESPSISSFSANDTSVELKTSSQSQTVIFTAVVSDNVGINSVSVSGATQSNVSGSTYTFTKSYAYGDYSFGSNTDVVTLTVSDAAGNSSTDSITITITKADDQAPVINSFTTSDNSFQLSTSSPTKTVTYSVNASDNRSISGVTVTGATSTGTSGSARTFSRTFNYNDFSFGSNTRTVTVTASDAGGNTATDTITHTITKVDDENPTASNILTDATGNAITLTTDNTSVTVRFSTSVDDNRGVTSVTWEGSDSSTVVSGDTYSYDKTYNYSDFTVNSTTTDTVSVVVSDAAGNVVTKTKDITITTTDSQDPTISSFTTNKAGNVVNLYSNSQNNTVTFSVVASDNVAVTSVSLPGTTTGSVSGSTYTFTKIYSYGDFSYGDTSDSFTATATDAAGNTTTSSITLTIRKEDNISPTISSFTADDSSVSLTTSSQSQSVSFTVVASDNRAVSTVSLPGTTSTGSSGNNYTFSKTYVYSDYSFGNSSDTLTATVTDAAGNSTTEDITVSITKADNANPSITNFSADDTSVALTTSSQSQTVTFTVVATDNVGISSVTIPGTTSGSSSGNSYTFTKTYNYSDYSFGSSTDTLTATVQDAAGNSITDDITINISKSDNQSPSISSAGNASGLSASTTSVALKTSDQSKTVTFTATLSDNVGISSVTFGGLTPSISGNDYTWTKTYDYDDYSFGSSTDSLTLTVADAAGNTSTDSVTINISKTDDQNPTVGDMTASNSSIDLSTSSQTETVTFSVVASDNVGISSVTWEGSQDSSSVSGSTYNFQRTYNYSDYSVGSTNSDTISVVVADAAGNTTTKSMTVTITTEDDQDPVISSLTSNKTSNIVLLPTSSQSNTVTFTVTATDNVTVSTVTLSGATYSSKSGNDWVFTKTYSYADFSFGDTFDTLTATATDGVGNTATSSIQMVVRKSDDQSPTISSFSANDSTVELKTSSQSQTVTFTVVASDNRGISTVSVPGTTVGGVSGNNYTFNKTYSYGDYSFGETTDTLTATATDAAGNSSTQSVTVSITKSDDQDPSITSFSADDSTVSLTTSSQSQTVTFTAIVTDNVAVTSVGLPGTSLSSSNSGTYVFTKTYSYADYSFGSSTDTLTLTVSDAARNSVSQDITISVSKQDDQNPVISSFSADDTTVSLLTSSQSQTVTFTIAASDNVGVSSVSLPGASLSSASGGSYVFTKTYDYDDYSFGTTGDTLTATVTDTAGNSITDDIDISVTKSDDQSPAISSFTADDTSVELKTSAQSQTVTFTVVATDNVGVSSVSVPGTTTGSVSGNNYTFTKTYAYADYNWGSNTHVLTATATDAAGNSQSQQLTVTITKTDDEDPVISSFSSDKTAITVKTSAKTASATLTAVVTDNRAVTSVTIGGVSATNTSGNNYSVTKTYNYDNLSIGSSNDNITVTASDAAGNTETDTVTIALSVVDDEDPTITSLSSDATDDAIELTTTAQNQTVTFTAVASDNIAISSISLTGATQTNVSGSTYTFTKAYAYGDYNFGDNTDTLTLTVSDAAGNSSTSSITIDITKTDNQAPSISNFTANNTTVTVSTSSQSASINISASLSDNVAINSVSLPGATFVSNTGGSYLWTKSYAYGDYSFGNTTDTLTLTVTDTNSNSTSDTLSITVSKVDDQNPTITSFSVSSSSVALTTSVQSVTRAFTVVASDNVAISTVSLPGTSLSSSNSGTYIFTKTYSYSDYSFGTSTDSLTVTVTDTAGNATTDSLDVTVTKTDNQDPSIDSFGADDTSVSLATSSQTQTVTFTAVVSDNVAIDTVSLPGTSLSSSNAGTYVFTKVYDYDDFGFGNSSETLTLTVSDTAGNSVTDTVSISISKVDDQNPSISSFTANDTTVELTTSSQSQTVVFTVAASDNVAVDTVSIPGTTAGSASGGSYTFSKTYSYGSYSFGNSSDTLTATVTDTAGNSVTEDITISISKVDNQPPSISNLTSNATNNSIELKTSDQTKVVTFTVSVSDNETVSSVALSTATLTNSNAGTYTFTKSYDYDDYSFGDTTDSLTLTAIDNHSNSATATIDIIVTKTDDQAPSISNFTVSDNTIELKSSSQSQSVTFSAVLSDNRAISSASLPNTTSNGNSGSTYNWSKTFSYSDYSYGTTTNTFTLTVVDAAGNTSTDSLDVTITKADDETPTITSFSANNTNVSLYSSATTQTVTFTAVASDNRAITAYSLPTATFSSNTGNNYVWTKTYDYDDYTYGSHSETLTVTFTDAAGNSSTATETISITKADNLDPTITSFSADDTSVVLTTSSQTQTVTFTAVATDNVAITTATLPSATYSGLSGSTYTWTKTYDYDDYNFGSSTDSLTLTVSDAAGNTSTDSVTINISKADNQDPTISSLTSNASGNAIELKSSDKKQTVIFTAVVSDNVGVDTIALSNASLSSANAGTYTFSKEFDYDDYSYGTTTSSHVLSVSDAAGNSAGQTINISVTKTDDQDPVIDSFTANNSSFNLYTSGTTSQVVTLTLVATDNRAVSSTSVTGGASLASVSGSSYVYTKTINYSDLANWGNNTFSFVATATDAAGNEDTASLNVVVAKIDNENPAISSFTASSSNVTLTTGSQSQTITFAASATDNRGITSMSLPTATATDTTGPDYAWSKTYNYDDYSFGSSTDVLTVTASDDAGNSSTSQVTINISKSDTQDPVITSFSASPSTIQLKTSDQTESVTFTAVASDNVGINTITIPNTIYQGVSGSSYTFTKTFDYADYSFGNTSETHTVTVTDAAGNSVTEDVSLTIQKIDDQNPTISSFTNNTSGNSIELKTSAQSQTITFTAVVADNREVTSISLTGATQTSSNSGNGTYTFTKDYDYSDYSFGSNSDSLTLSVGDAAGNTSSQSVTISITKTDDQNPTISSFSADTTSVALKTSDQSKTVTITATLTDNVGVTSVTMPGTNANISGNDYTFTKTYNYDDYSFGSSTDTLTLTVGDAAGNSSTESVTINISKSDDQNPSISSLSADDTSIEVKTSAQTQTVYFTAVVTDNVGINSISLTGATQDSVSGSSYIFSKEYDYADYNFGSNTDTLTLSVSDAAGNTATDTITITITKTDDQNPSITSLGADDTSVSLTTSSQTQTVTFTAVVSDNVGIDSISLTGATQTSSNAGTYTFTKTYDYDDYSFGSATDTPTLTVADAAGNSVTDTITINITKGDDENPVISSLSANNSTITVKTSDQSQTVTFTAVVTDNVGISSIGLTGATQTSVSGSSYTFTKDYDYDDYNFGSNTDSLTLTVADAAGNSVTDSITITINKTDDQDPVISSSSTNATNDTITLSTTSQSADVVFTIAATDNRAITSTTHSQLSSAGTQSGNNYTWTRTYDYDDFSFGSQTSANTITVADAAGNTATVNLPITVQKIDNQNPTISSVSADDSTVELKTSSQSQTVTFTVVATDNRAIESVTLSGATSSGSSGNNYTFTKTYSYGDYSFGNSSDTLTATATDAAGNSATQTITVSISKTDDQNPSIGSFGADDTTVELKTSSQTQTVTFTAVVSDNVGISSVSLPGTSLSSVNSGTYVFTKTYDYDDYSFGDATDTLTLTVTDTASNSVTDTVTISINKADDQDPSISSFSADDTTVELKTSSQTQTVTFTAAVSDNVAINSVSLPGTTLSSSNAGTYVFSKTYDYDDYSFGSSSDTLTLTVSDTAGNSVTDTVTISITKSDDQNPSISSFGADDTSVTLATSSQTQTVTFTAVVTDNVAIQSVSLPGTTLSSSNAGTYVFSKTYDYDDYSFGSSSDTLTLTVTDTANNSVTDTVTISISKSDDQNPSISSFSADDTSVELKTSSQTQTVTFTVVATDNVAVSSVSLPGTTAGSVSGSNYTFTKEYDYDDYSFGDSSDTLTATVTDSANNSVTQDITISINKADDQDPTCTVSANDTTVELKTSSQTQVVAFTVTVSDNVAINSVTLPGTTLLYTTTSGANTQYNFRKTYDYDDFSFGDSSETLTATATDTAGNTATDSITISINKADDQNPSISSFTADDTSVEVKTSAKTQTVTFTVVASDNVGVSSVSIPGTTAGSVSGSNYTFTKEYDYDDLSYGSSSETLTATVTDTSNLTATDTITISISKIDDEDPSISSFGADDTSVELKTSSQTQTVTFTAVVGDNVGVNSVTLPGTTLSSAVSGTHIFTKTYDYDDYSFGNSSDTLTLTVADTAGQNGGTTNSVTQDITISISKVDDQDPTCSVGADKNSIDLKTSAQTQTVTFTVTASDNASIGSVSLPGTTYSSTSGNDRLFTKTYDYDDYTFGDHSETLTATVVDGAGNTATDTITISISKIDDQVPTISSFSADDTSVELKSSDKTQTVTFTVVATDNVSVQTVSLPGTTFSSSSGSTSTYTKLYDYDDYSYGTTSETLTVTVTDTAGNTSTDTETITIVKSDDENPVISSFTSSKSAVSLTSTSQSDTVTFYAEFTDNRAVSSYSLPGASYQSLNNGVYSWTKSYSYSDYSYGTSTDTLTLTVEDAAGNSVTSSINISVTKSDNISPTISNLTVSTSTVDLYSSDKTETITISANISDNVGISTYSVQGATFSSVSNGVYTWTKTYDYDDYDYGSTSDNVVVIATDAAGNRSTSSSALTINKYDDSVPYISSFTASPESFDLGADNTSQTVTFSATMNDNVAITSYSLVDGDGTSLGSGSVSGAVYTWTKTYTLTDYSGNNHVQNFTVSASDAAGNSASSQVSVVIATLSALIVPGSLSITTSTNLTATDESVYAIENQKERTAVLFGGDDLPDYYIKIPVNLNNYVTKGSSNLGRATGSPDDCWGLQSITFANTDVSGSDVTTTLPAQTGTFKVGQITIDDSNISSSLSSGVSLQNFNVMMTISADSAGNLTSTCDVQRQDNSTGQTASIVDSALFASYLHFSENDNTTATNNLVGSDKQPSNDWKGATSASDRDALTDNLSTTLTNAEVASKFSSQIAATNNSFNGQAALSSWNMSFNAITASSSSALTKHARARIGRKASPDTTTVFRQGDKIFTSGSSAYSLTFRDHDNTLQTIASGDVYGVLEQTATGAFTGTPQN